MKIHHLNCGTLNPLFPRTQAIIYCLLVESNQGLILIDTGFGLQDYSKPTRLMRFLNFFMGAPCKDEETAAYQIVERGFDCEDVRHIVLTHLHLDHAGGLRDFPQAQVHVFKTEFDAAMNPHGLIERAYNPVQWSHNPNYG
jgi:glyoxylase-like metal-dependent hydrolase (beta-lactamase superfamily II)